MGVVEVKNFLWVHCSGHQFIGAARSNFSNWRGWYEVPGGLAKLEPLLGLRVAAGVRVCPVWVSWNTNLVGRTLLCSPPFELGLSSFTSLQEARQELKSPVVRGN